jgi:hypothetical protein
MFNDSFTGKNLGGIFFASVIVLIVLGSPFFAFVALKSLDVSNNSIQTEQSSVEETQQSSPTNLTNNKSEIVQWYKNAESRPFIMLMRMAVLSATALFGALGALLSVLTRTGSSKISALELVGLEVIGAVFSIMLALIFAGGFIQGSLFPRGLYSWFSVIYLHQEFAKLLVWSFIAGFSERAVPQILRTFAERLQGAADEPQANDKKTQQE